MGRRKVIAIDINEVLRAKWVQFDKFYVIEYGDEGAPDEDESYCYDYYNNYVFKDTKEEIKVLNENANDDISPLDYIVDEKTGKAKVDDYIFDTEYERYSALDNYKRFLYQDYVNEIYGGAPQIYTNSNLDLDKFLLKYEKDYEFVFISKENKLTIPHTLIFLAKYNCRGNNYHFFDTEDQVWGRFDTVITTDPKLVELKPKDKKVVLLTRPYNENLDENVDLKCNYHLKDLINNVEFEELIGYKE